MRKEITVVYAAESIDEGDPFLRVYLKLVKLVGIYDITQVAGDHFL